MLSKEKMMRISYLSKKSKDGGLTESERLEQIKLREEYLLKFRNNFKTQLESITVVDEEGNDVTPLKIKDAKNSDVVN